MKVKHDLQIIVYFFYLCFTQHPLLLNLCFFALESVYVSTLKIIYLSKLVK